MIKNYIKFLTKASNQHGVHSPFVYNLVVQCLYAKSSLSTIDQFSGIKKSLKNNHHEIIITDFGAGSKIFKNNTRKISSLVGTVCVSKKHGLLLNRLVAYLNVNQALELGTSIGLATSTMCIDNKNIKVDTIEGCPEILKVADEQFLKYGYHNQITSYNGDLKDLLPSLVSVKKYDLIYIDGNHQKEATLLYFKECLKAKHNDSVFIFDDIYWSNGMQEAWEEIKNHPEVKVTIDIFQWGMVFFRREQEKEHFKIRF